MAISLNDDKKHTEGNEKQHTRVISTKIAVDQYESFNLLAEYLFKIGVVENPTPSAFLRNYITQLVSSYHDDIENYRITKKLSTHDDDLLQPIIMANTQNKQNLSLESSNLSIQREQQLPLVNDGRVHHQDMNMVPVKDKDQPEVQDCDNLPIGYKNPLSSSIQSTQEDERYVQIQKELQDTKRELEDLRQQQYQKAEEIGGNGNNIVSSTREEDEYFRLDLNRFITVLNLIARHPRNRPHLYAYLEPDKNKDIAQVIAPYNFEEYKNEKAAKRLEADTIINNWG
jgi:hypothetical protein